MTIEGLQNQICYLPREAYDRAGRQLYRSKWDYPFAPGEMIPDPGAAKDNLKAGGPEAARIREIGDPNTEDYERLQIRSVRTAFTLDAVRRPLYWGKVKTFRRRDDGWEEINHREWDEKGTEVVPLLWTVWRRS